jgi:6-phosphogluconolactonase (cycloisomerase 2 family)
MRVQFGLRIAGLCSAIVLLWSLGACGGGTGGKQFPPPPPSSSAEYLFAVSNNQVLSFTVNATNGALGTPVNVAGPATSAGILGDPAGKFLYVSDPGTDEIHVFSISTNGTLTEIASSPFFVGNPTGTPDAAGLAMDSAGQFLYATDPGNSSVAAFKVTSSTGALTAIGAPLLAGISPQQAVVDSSGQFLYAPDFGDSLGGVLTFGINGSTGALTQPTTFDSLRSGPLGVATQGQFVYVSAQGSNQVVALAINSAGALSIVAAYPTGQKPTGIVLDPTGKYLYVANNTDSTISAYNVNASSGALTEMNGSPFAAGAAPWYLAVDPLGKFLYATNPASNTITGYTIASSGTLTQFVGSPASAGTQPVVLTVVTVPQ